MHWFNAKNPQLFAMYRCWKNQQKTINFLFLNSRFWWFFLIFLSWVFFSNVTSAPRCFLWAIKHPCMRIFIFWFKWVFRIFQTPCTMGKTFFSSFFSVFLCDQSYITTQNIILFLILRKMLSPPPYLDTANIIETVHEKPTTKIWWWKGCSVVQCLRR